MRDAVLQRGRNEKDLPTEQSQAKTNARVSCENGHAGRSRRVEAAPSERAQAADRDHSAEATAAVPRLNNGRQTFGKSRRLRRREEFLRVQSRGRRRAAGPFLVMTLARGDRGATRLGITATRKTGSAVVRNRAKRLVREFFRRHYHELAPATDIVVIVRPCEKKLSYAEVERELSRALLSPSA